MVYPYNSIFKHVLHIVHTTTCNLVQTMKKCSSIAIAIRDNGYLKLSTAYKSAFPIHAYKTDIARLRLLQMPLACIRLGCPKKGSAWYLIEFFQGVDYTKFALFAAAALSGKPSGSNLGRAEIKALLGLAQSDRERELIRYSTFRSSGVSLTAARKQFGFQNMQARILHIEECVKEAYDIRKAIEDLATIENRAVLQTMGVCEVDSSSESEDMLFDHDEGHGASADSPQQPGVGQRDSLGHGASTDSPQQPGVGQRDSLGHGASADSPQQPGVGQRDSLGHGASADSPQQPGVRQRDSLEHRGSVYPVDQVVEDVVIAHPEVLQGLVMHLRQSRFNWFEFYERVEDELHGPYPRGPPLTHLPLPVKDPSRPWGSQSCLNCSGYCTGHYTTVMLWILVQ